MTAALGCQRPVLSRRDLSFRASRYTLDVMPAVTGKWATCHRPSRSSIAHCPSPKKGFWGLSGPTPALRGRDMLLRSGNYARASNFLIATGVPAGARLRPSLAPPSCRDRVRPASVTPRGLRLPRTPLWSARRSGEGMPVRAPSVSASVGESSPVPRRLVGGFVQLSSI